MNWPLLVADNFYSGIDTLREYAKTQEYSPGINFPGARTEPIHEINNNLFQGIALKTLALLYPNDYRSISFSATSYLQRVPPNLIDGWVHVDQDSQITSILYLNQDINAGTSLFKPLVPFPDINHYTYDKRSYLQIVNSGDKISKKEEDHYKLIRDENNKQFKKTCFINSEYNRCVMFDAMEYHAAENFYSRSKEDRYTYITFWHELWHEKKQINPNLSTSQRVVP